MIEQRARVVEVGERHAWVELIRTSGCASCSANGFCGTSVAAKVLGNCVRRTRALSDLPLRVGDEVVVGLAESALLKGSVAVYIVPLALMLGGALFGDLTFSATGEAMAVLLGGIGLLVGLVWLRIFSHGIRTDRRFQPVVLECLTQPPVLYEHCIK
jgi:sigma-E factor negative regulatory protein RseC